MVMKKCKHNWQVANVVREQERNWDNGTVQYLGWIGVFVCPLCMSVKNERLREYHG